MIHRIKEGESMYHGINFCMEPNSILNFKLRIPIWVSPSKVYGTWARNYFEGRILTNLAFGFRIRKWWIIPGEVFLFRCGFFKTQLKYRILATREQIEDGPIERDFSDCEIVDTE